MTDWQGRFDSNGIWRPAGRWGKDGTWRGASAPRRAGACGTVSGHGVIRLGSRGAVRFVTMREWSDAVSYPVGTRLRFTVDQRGQAVDLSEDAPVGTPARSGRETVIPLEGSITCTKG